MLARVKLKGIDGGPHKRWSMWFNSMQREEPYQGLTWYESFWKKRVPFGTYTQVVHGCRQLVSWDVGLSPATSATLVFSCRLCNVDVWNNTGTSLKIQYAWGYYNVFEKILRTSFKKTADDKLEEGEGNVKSVCPLCPGLHTCYIGWDNELQCCEAELIY